jgi:hypothetical protein
MMHPPSTLTPEFPNHGDQSGQMPAAGPSSHFIRQSYHDAHATVHHDQGPSDWDNPVRCFDLNDLSTWNLVDTLDIKEVSGVDHWQYPMSSVQLLQFMKDNGL